MDYSRLDNFYEKQCCGSVTFWFGAGCGSGSVPVSNGSGCCSGWSKNIWILRIRLWILNTRKKSKRSHKTVDIKIFLTILVFSIFAWWWKDQEPDLYLWLTDPDADPGGPKTYGSYWSGCGSRSTTLMKKFQSRPANQRLVVYLEPTVLAGLKGGPPPVSRLMGGPSCTP